jgi:RNA-directed DNA polymerase
MHAGNGQLQQIDKSRQLQRKLYLAAKKCRERRFHALYDRILRPDVLWRAWQEVKANGGSAGVDGVSLEEVERQGVASFLEVIAADLKAGRYQPQRVLRVYIPKPDGRQRPLVRVSTEAQCGATSPGSRQSAVARLVDSRRRHPRVF